MTSIVATAVATLVVTILAGVGLDKIRSRAPRLALESQDAVPFEVGGQQVGAYVFHLENVSSATIEELTLTVEVDHGELRSGGVDATPGLEYQENQQGGSFRIEIPYLKGADYLSFILVAESENWVGSKPSVSLRSPNSFSQVSRLRESGRKRTIRTFGLAGAIAAGVAGFTSSTFIGGIFPDIRFQREVAMESANAVGLHELSAEIFAADSVSYYTQGDLAFARASLTTDAVKRERYADYLRTILEAAPSVALGSRCAILYNLSKIERLRGRTDVADLTLTRARSDCPGRVAELERIDSIAHVPTAARRITSP